MSDLKYYPSAVVNLRLRFDETLQVAPSAVALAQELGGDLGAGIGATGARKAAGAPRRRRITVGTITVEDRNGTRTVDAAPINQSWKGLEPLVTPDDPMTMLMNRIPLGASVMLPGPRQAGTFQCEFNYRDLPIDPRLIRAVGVEVHLGSVPADDFARGMAGERDPDGRLLSIVKTRSELLDPMTGQPDLNLQTLVLYGTADEWETDHGDGLSRVTIQGRDLRGIFLDAKVVGARVAKVNLEQGIDRVVADILGTLPSKFDLVFDVFTDRNEWPNAEIPSPADRGGVTRLRQESKGGAAGSQPPGGDKITYWDLVTQYCNLVGGIPYFRGSALWIRPARSIYQTLTDRRLPTPFRGGKPRRATGPEGGGAPEEEIRVRRLVHGRHVKSLKIRRKFGGVVVPLVQCISIDDRVRGKQCLLVEQWPPATSVAGQLKTDGDVIRVPVPGIVDRDRLRSIAQDVYEEIGRGEVNGSVETDFLTSFGGDDQDPDLLGLRPTDPLEIVVDVENLASRSPIITELVRHESRTFQQEVDDLTAHIGDPVLARVLVASTRGKIVGQLDVFRVTAARFDFTGTAIRISAEFATYVVARHGDRTQEQSDQRQVTQRRVKVKGKTRAVRVKLGHVTAVGPSSENWNAPLSDFFDGVNQDARGPKAAFFEGQKAERRRQRDEQKAKALGQALHKRGFTGGGSGRDF